MSAGNAAQAGPVFDTQGWCDQMEKAPRDGTPISVEYEDGTTEDGVFWERETRCCVLGSRAGSFPDGWTSKEVGYLPVEGIVKWKPLDRPEGC